MELRLRKLYRDSMNIRVDFLKRIHKIEIVLANLSKTRKERPNLVQLKIKKENHNRHY